MAEQIVCFANLLNDWLMRNSDSANDLGRHQVKGVALVQLFDSDSFLETARAQEDNTEAPLEDMKLMLPLWIQFQGWIIAPRLDAHPRRYYGSLLLCEQKQFDRMNESQYLQVPCSETSVSPLSVTNLRKTL